MKSVRVASSILALMLSATAFAAAPAYKIIDRIKVPDGGFDYANFDPATNRVYMARTTFTTVIDVKTGAVSQLNSAAHGHMTLPIPGTTLAVLPQGQGMIRIVDLKTDTVVADLPGGKNPDGATYDPSSKLVFVMNHSGGDSTVVDPVKHTVVGTIPVGGTLEFPVADGAGKVFVNIEDQNKIGVIDVKTMKTVAYYPLAGCDGPTGLAYVSGAKLLVAACDDVAKVIAADTGKEIASLVIGGGADAAHYDAARHVVLIPCGETGELDIISVADPAHISVIQKLPTQVGSRTGIVNPNTGRFYTIASKRGPAPAGGGRAQALPGSFEVLVVGP